MARFSGQAPVKFEIPLIKVRILVRITTSPTEMNMAFMGILPTSLAAMGAAINPPMIRPGDIEKKKCFKII